MLSKAHAAPPQIVPRHHQIPYSAKRARRVRWVVYRVYFGLVDSWVGVSLSPNLEAGTGKGFPSLKQPSAGGEVKS